MREGLVVDLTFGARSKLEEGKEEGRRRALDEIESSASLAFRPLPSSFSATKSISLIEPFLIGSDVAQESLPVSEILFSDGTSSLDELTSFSFPPSLQSPHFAALSATSVT